jgi:hypothetical protein
VYHVSARLLREWQVKFGSEGSRSRGPPATGFPLRVSRRLALAERSSGGFHRYGKPLHQTEGRVGAALENSCPRNLRPEPALVKSGPDSVAESRPNYEPSFKSQLGFTSKNLDPRPAGRAGNDLKRSLLNLRLPAIKADPAEGKKRLLPQAA